MGKRRRDSEVSSSSDSSASSSSTSTSDGSSTDSFVASRRKKSSKKDTSPDRIQKNPSNPKASGSGKTSAASVALSRLIQATFGGAGEEIPVPAQGAAVEEDGEASEIGAPARAVAAAGGEAQERPNPAVGQALLQLASFIEAQQAPKSNRKKRLKPSIKQSRRMLKRLRRGVSNKRVGQLKSKYRLDVEDSMDFKVPSIDFEMHLKLQKLLGPSTGKGVNDVEKSLYKVQQSMLPIFSVLAFLESKELEGDAGKAVRHLAELIGRSYFDVSDLRRRNILELVGPAIIPLLEDRDIFEVSEGRDLFGSSVMKRLSKSGRFVRELVDLDVGGQRKGKLPARERLSLPPSLGQQSSYQGRQNNHSSGRTGNIRDDNNSQRQPDFRDARNGVGDQGRQVPGSASRWNDNQQDWSNNRYAIDLIYSLSSSPPALALSIIGGRIRHFWRAWGLISADPWILNVVRNGLELEFESPPTMLRFPSSARMGVEQLSIGRDEVSSLIQKGAAVRASRIRFVSQMFIIKKQSGGFRPIINLKSLNQFVVYRHFKMENLASLRHLIMKGDWMVKLDLKDAYLTVPVHKDFHDFLQFVWEGEVFQFTCFCLAWPQPLGHLLSF